MINDMINFFTILYGKSQPLWVQVWVSWMILLNTLSLVFIKKRLAKIVFGAWSLNAVTMTILFANFGYNRLLGLSHIIWWTPLLIYIWNIKDDDTSPKLFRYWYQILFVTIFLSLILDYIDVLRYFFQI